MEQTHTQNPQWLHGVNNGVTKFLADQQDVQIPGYFRYSYSGDLFTRPSKMNLPGSIFALKLLALMGETDTRRAQETTKRVLSLQRPDGTYADPFVARKRLFRATLSSFRHGHLRNLGNREYVHAETRQAYSALLLHGVVPGNIWTDIPTDPDTIVRFLSQLDWSLPWGAGSHFSHLMFFLSLLHKTNRLPEKPYREAVETAVSFMTSLQHSDGAWYTGSPSHRQKVNGAMKVISGLIIDNLPFDHPDKLIDLCLIHSAKHTGDACDQINQVLVLRYANEQCHHRYRRDEIQKFCFEALEVWQEYYYPKLGGFSFHKHRANDRYYGAKVSLGLDEPDIHGTLMFVWGLSMIKKLVPIESLEFLTEIKS